MKIKLQATERNDENPTTSNGKKRKPNPIIMKQKLKVKL